MPESGANGAAARGAGLGSQAGGGGDTAGQQAGRGDQAGAGGQARTVPGQARGTAQASDTATSGSGGRASGTGGGGVAPPGGTQDSLGTARLAEDVAAANGQHRDDFIRPGQFVFGGGQDQSRGLGGGQGRQGPFGGFNPAPWQAFQGPSGFFAQGEGMGGHRGVPNFDALWPQNRGRGFLSGRGRGRGFGL